MGILEKIFGVAAGSLKQRRHNNRRASLARPLQVVELYENHPTDKDFDGKPLKIYTGKQKFIKHNIIK